MTVFKRGKSWVARRDFQKHFKSRGDAQKFSVILESTLMEALRKFEARVKPCCRIRDKLAEFLRDCKAGMGRRPCSQSTLDRHKKRLLMFDSVFHSRPLDAVTREEVAAWMARRLKSGKHGKPIDAGTVNADMISLKSFARWAQSKGYAPPALAFMVVPKLRVKGLIAGTNRKPPRALEMGELLCSIAMVKAVREDIGLLLEGMVLFCLRPHGLWNLRRGDLKLPENGEPGRLRCMGLKGFHERELSIQPGSEQHAWAESCIKLFKETHRRLPRGNEPLLVNTRPRGRNKISGWTTANLDNALARVCGTLGIKFTPYQIRHSVISWLHQNPGISPAATQTAAAHASVTTQDVYGKRRGSEAIPAYDALSIFVGQHRRDMEKGGGSEGGVSGV